MVILGQSATVAEAGGQAVILGRGEESPWGELPAVPDREITAGEDCRHGYMAGR